MSFVVIPAIDLKDGQCVRLRQGRMEDSTTFGDDPVAMAAQWVEQGAKRLHLVDLNGAFAGEPVNQDAITAIARRFPELPIQIGGGIRDLETIGRYLDAGVRWTIIGTQAVRDPEFVEAACSAYPGHIIVGLDARDGRVATTGWSETSEVTAVALAERFSAAGVSALVYTDIGRDGMLQGVNVESTAALARSTAVPVIASGGVAGLEDIRQLLQTVDAGVCGVIAGRALYEGRLNLPEAQALADGVRAQ
ncbi:MAG: 1-(5-phosphoribosyl)-5-[(5-phosphoribosylamino)methylideneamino]imidazole-4-carboxamide isomerase [Pseudomonadota bacterium]|nr:1-(5-phosphoribosyl)-5-[(5-phosphoribosylamino)methylideneamino]imidazole-4-carboxamide isomerase [Pseudomonadota bacterium]